MYIYHGGGGGGGEDNNSESAVTDLINDLEWQIASPIELLRLWV